MSGKRSKEKWDAIRARYTWHLREPFVKHFDHTHWWERSTSEIEPLAVLYEISRRHPDVCQRRKMGQNLIYSDGDGISNWKPFDSDYSLPSIALQSWPSLCEEARHFWKARSSGLRGAYDQDFEFDTCWLDRNAVRQMIAAQMKLFQKEKGAELSEVEVWGLAQAALLRDPQTEQGMEFEFVGAALRAYRAGHVMIALAPNLRTDEAGPLAERVFSEHRKIQTAVTGKGKPRLKEFTERLFAVSQFEELFLDPKKRRPKRDLFDSYRDLIDSVSNYQKESMGSYFRELALRETHRQNWSKKFPPTTFLWR